jgi:precorrin-6A/cobalt-precorrin-6A reductase
VLCGGKSLKRILILGGTQHALELADAVEREGHFYLIYSLAGRVAQPRTPKCETRVGGFGGVDGLVRYLRDNRIDALIDATHPFAAQISRNAVEASRQTGVPLIAFTRPPWAPVAGDRWRLVADMTAAADLVAQRGGRVFLSIGRQEVAAFADCKDADFVIRSIEPSDEPLPPRYELLLARGPFRVEDELELLKHQRIDLLVTKNSGGSATYAKIEAARSLEIEVVMIDRPIVSGRQEIGTVEEVPKWLAAL